MIPHTPKAIGFIVQRLMTHVLPELQTNFGVADVALIGFMLDMIGQDFDRAAQARLEDIREMRELFAEAEPLVADGVIGERIRKARTWSLDDLRIANLDEIHAFHSQLLIDVHARVEARTTAPFAQLDARIWDHLERHAERHRYEIAF